VSSGSVSKEVCQIYARADMHEAIDLLLYNR
jgi:hypothetical protein